MEVLLLIFITAAICLWLWISGVSILCLFLDPDLESVQRYSQMVMILLLPYIGASIVLKFVNDHSPEVINRFYIPWPFKGLVQNKEFRSVGSGSNNEEIPGAHSGSFRGGSDGGGSGD